MRHRFTDKIILITGGSSGIGLATAKQFAAEGGTVIVTGRNSDSLQRAATEIGTSALALKADVGNHAELASVIDEIRQLFGRLDILFANAGVSAILPIEATTPEIWDNILDINLKGVFFTVRAALPLMSAGGAIVLNSSLAARRSPPGMSAYAASKAGVVALGRTLAIDFAPRGIRVNVLSPGPIDTPLPQKTLGMTAAALPQLAAPENCTPLGRIGRPDEAAAAALFLASDDASFITGIDLVVDGGISAS